jgi:hypothetical protein
MSEAEVAAHHAAITRRRVEAVLAKHGLTYAQGIAMPLRDLTRLKGLGRKALKALRAERLFPARLKEARRVLEGLRGHYAHEPDTVAALDTALLALDDVAGLP